MATVFVCDRCGAPIPVEYPLVPSYRWKDPAGQMVELCERCNARLAAWLSGNTQP